MRRDMRRINKIWDFLNPMGEWYTFAKIGSGKNSYIATLHTGLITETDKQRLGEIYQQKHG